MGLLPLLAAAEYRRGQEQAASAHQRYGGEKKDREDKHRADNDNLRYEDEAARRVEAFESKARETLPPDETRSVREIRDEYERMQTQIWSLEGKERRLTDEMRVKTDAQLAAAKERLELLRADQEAARKSVGFWKRLWGEVEQDPAVRAFDQNIRDTEGDIYRLAEQVKWDDKQLANPLSEVERLKQAELARQMEATAEKYPWVTRSPHQLN